MNIIRTVSAVVLVLFVVMIHASAEDNAPKTKQIESKNISKSDEKPIYMLNAIWYKPDGGKKKYQEYLKAAGPIVVKHGGKLMESYIPEKALIGEFDADLVFVVKWPDKKNFMVFASDPAYRSVSHLRKEAISKSFLIQCKKSDNQ